MNAQSFGVDSFFTEKDNNGKIEGVVFENNEDDSPLGFVDITVKNTELEATTNIDGSFSLNMEPGTYTLVFNFIGYKTVEISNIEVSSNNTTKLLQKLEELQLNTDLTLEDTSKK